MLRKFIVTFLFVPAVWSVQLQKEQARNATSDRSEKFLSLFSVVRFANSFCYGSNGYNGTCLTSAECAAKGGSSAGSCASGFGVCCTVLLSRCGSTTNLNNTYWLSPGYSNSYTTSGQCSLYVSKCSSNVCQIRLDFINFVTANPDEAAATACTTCTQCLTDIFTVSGASNNVPAICGTNTNQHMYLDMTPGTNVFTLNMLLTGTATSRTWNIRVAQIPCGTTYTAPDNCLQWFTSASGTIMSFDYQFTSTPLVQKLANQDYTICIRTNAGFCGICYAVCTGVPTGTPTFLLGTPTTAAAVDTNCANDWIQIPCAINQQNSGQVQSDGTACVNKICGGVFSTLTTDTMPTTIYSYRKPFEVRVYTDSFDDATDISTGFCLSYTQQPCPSAG